MPIINPGGGEGVWGEITGDINAQTDLSSPAKVEPGAGSQIWNEDLNQWEPTTNFANVPTWTYVNNTTMADPGTGNIRLNNTDLSLVTQVAASNITDPGAPIGDLINIIRDNAFADLREYGDFTKSFFAVITNVTDNGTWFLFDVTEVESTSFDNNSILAFDLVDNVGVTNPVDTSNVLTLDNTTSFTPDADFEPATKKYVDDNAGGLGYVLATWGANLQTAGRFPAINGKSDAPEVPGLGIMASAQVPADGTIDVLTYYSATGDTTTQFKIIKNGVLAYTFTCDAPYGRETGIGVPVALGDNIAIEYDAGTKPANGIYTMYIN